MKDEHMTIRIGGEKASPPLPPRPRKKRPTARFYAIIFSILLLGVLVLGAYELYNHFSSASVTVISGTHEVNTDMSHVVSRVGNLMLLPEETPTIATVSDLSKLQGQKFFANAEQGDIVLMYAHAKKAILYSPTLNKIIEVAPITNDK